MSVKITASYQRPEELPPIIQALKPFIEDIRYAQQKGRYKRIYIYLRKGYESGIVVKSINET